ncbi:hypothetical protein DMN91_013008 [Ooceraea biroi]|uniref:Uncharacterized protein n=1 Tax=Ooceraea biroi TaxID=2015173 RepID=A0A3L8D4Q2_OOCBI|nr:hypothetical protein DMN91_013008 [Ooceraea biroi]
MEILVLRCYRYRRRNEHVFPIFAFTRVHESHSRTLLRQGLNSMVLHIDFGRRLKPAVDCAKPVIDHVTVSGYQQGSSIFLLFQSITTPLNMRDEQKKNERSHRGRRSRSSFRRA